ncbi:dihydropteroate synthase [Caldicellulosiruptoraceae bacterium PP1]
MRLISKDANLKKLLLSKGFEPENIERFLNYSENMIFTFEKGNLDDHIKHILMENGYHVIYNENEFFLSTTRENFNKTKCLIQDLLKDQDICSFEENFSRILLLKEGRKIDLNKTNIMGIMNITPDSFYQGSRYQNLDAIQEVSKKMIEDGADIIDIGGESTRPFSEPITEEEEINRVIPAIKKIREINNNIPISIDTYRSRVAKLAIEAGADIINDISGGLFDKEMFRVAASLNVPIIIMHIKGTPKDMQQNPYYDDVVKEIYEFFEMRIEDAIENGVKKENIILDPGIGFGKRVEDNLEIIRRCDEFKSLGCPVLIGASRKSTIGKVLGDLPPEERLEGTIAISVICAMKGIEFVRVHDVKENKRAVTMTNAIYNY